MKWLRRIDRETSLLVIAPVIVSFVSAVVASAFIKGTPFFIFIGLSFLIMVLYILSFAIVGKKNADYMAAMLDARLPSPQIVFENEDVARNELVKVVNDANEFIAATGGRSSVTDYLTAIEHKLTHPKIVYRRVLLGDEITKEMCQHLCRILAVPNLRNKTIICRHRRIDLGYFTTTDAGWFTFMPSPRQGAPLENFIKITRNPKVVGFFRTYISEYLVGTADERIDSPERVRELCETKVSNDMCAECGERKKRKQSP